MVDIIAQTRDEHTTMRMAPTAAGDIHRNYAAAGFATFCHQNSSWRRTSRFISSRADTVIGQGLPLLAIVHDGRIKGYPGAVACWLLQPFLSLAAQQRASNGAVPGQRNSDTQDTVKGASADAARASG